MQTERVVKTPKILIDAMEYIKTGASAKSAAEAFGIPYKALLKGFKKHGMSISAFDSRRKNVELSDEEMLSIYQFGGGIRALVSKTGLNRTTLYRRLHNLGCVQRKTPINKSFVHDLIVEGYSIAEIAGIIEQETGETVMLNSIRSILHRLGMKSSDHKNARRKRLIMQAKEKRENN